MLPDDVVEDKVETAEFLAQALDNFVTAVTAVFSAPFPLLMLALVSAAIVYVSFTD